MPEKDLPQHGVVAAASLLAAGGNLKRLRRKVARLPPLPARCGLPAVKKLFCGGSRSRATWVACSGTKGA